MRASCLVAGLLVLALAWLGPAPALAGHSFTAHMTMHMAVVAVAAPLLSLAVVRTRRDPAGAWPRLFSPIPASLVELFVVWGWHAPALHRAARSGGGFLALEQGSFLAAGLLLWIAAFGAGPGQRGTRATAGILALLLTSMHMTLLGALIALAPRPLYRHGAEAVSGLAPLADQQLGGAIMLLVGGLAYLAGGLGLAAAVLRSPRVAEGPS